MNENLSTAHDRCLYHDNDLIFFLKTNEIPLPQNFRPHIHEHFEIYCFLSGNGEFVVEGNHYPLSPGTIILTRPNEYHKFLPCSETPYSRFVFEFSEKTLVSFDPNKRLLSPFLDRPLGHLNSYKPSQFKLSSPVDLFYQAIIEGADVELERLHVMASLFKILTNIALVFEGQNVDEYEPTVAERLVAFLEHNLSRDLTIKELSNRFFLSKTQLERVFKQHTQITLKEYIMVKRLYHAKSLLENGMSAADACANAGFNDYSSFYRAYKKRFGASPLSSIGRRIPDTKE